MKQTLIILIISILLIIPLTGQEKDKKVEEYLDVINVEIFARALRGGIPVGGLSKEDLQLFENGTPVEITSLTEVKRKMGIQDVQLETRDIIKKKSRIFYLFFWISESGTSYQEALDHFFKNIYHKKDYVILATQTDVFKMPPGTSIKSIRNQLSDSINKITANISQFQKSFARRLETNGNHLRDLVLEYNLTRDASRKGAIAREIGQKTENLTQSIRGELKQFKFNHLKINAAQMLGFAKSIKNSTVEKWGITFFQPMAFPIIDSSNEYISAAFSMGSEDIENKSGGISALNRAIMEVKRIDHLTFLNKVNQAFFENNTPFHTILLNSTEDIVTNEEFLRKDYIASEWEEVFRNISKVSGGEIVSGTKIIESMNQISAKEDIYYILTYSPQALKDEKRDLKLKSNNPDLKIYHHKRIDLTRIENISMSNFSYTHPKISFTMENYRMLYKDNQFTGKVMVHFSSVDTKGDHLRITKELNITEEETHLSLDLNLKYNSKYTVTVLAIDQNAQKKAIFSRKVQTPQPPDSMRKYRFTQEIPKIKQDKLPGILLKTAAYCEKLKRAALHFYCQEKITEEFLGRQQGNYSRFTRRDRFNQFTPAPRRKKRQYIYDYQIILKDGEMKETRTLIFEKHKKVNIKNAPLKSRFISEYSFYMPLIFAKENQNKYNYMLIKEQRIKGNKTYKISVEPKSPELGDVAHGIAWVDQKDGSIIKILVHPRSFKGVKKLQQKALRRGYDLMLSDEHLYLKERGGIRFPTQTMISERYTSILSSRQTEFESSRTYFTYTKYRFFDVNTEVTTHDPM